jgi:hypothetical protein
MMELVEGQGKWGVIILYERRMETKEDEESKIEEGLDEPKDVEVYEVQMVQSTADWIKRAMCLIFEGRYEWMMEDGEEKCDIRREMCEERIQRFDAKWQVWNMCERELGVEGHQGQKPEWIEMWAILIPIGSDWWDIFHKRSWILRGRWGWWISFHVSGPMWGEGE